MKKHNPYFDNITNEDFYCPVCKRLTPPNLIEKHHLIPKSKKGKETASVCVSCGDMLHKIFSLKEMRDNYNTIDKILEHEDIIKWVKWISKKPNDFSICMKSKKGKNRKNRY